MSGLPQTERRLFMRKLMALGITLVLVVSILAGCSAQSSKTDGDVKFKGDKVEVTSESGKATISDKGDKVVVKDETGKTTVGQNVDLPKGYPEDLVPLYKAESVNLAFEDEKGEYSVQYTSTSSAQDVTAYYESILKNADNKQFYSNPKQNILSGVIDGKVISILVSPGAKDDKKSDIVIGIVESE